MDLNLWRIGNTRCINRLRHDKDLQDCFVSEEAAKNAMTRAHTELETLFIHVMTHGLNISVDLMLGGLVPPQKENYDDPCLLRLTEILVKRKSVLFFFTVGIVYVW